MNSAAPFVISRHPLVMCELIHRIRAREMRDRIARQLGLPVKSKPLSTRPEEGAK